MYLYTHDRIGSFLVQSCMLYAVRGRSVIASNCIYCRSSPFIMCILFQSSLMCLSQLRPNKLGPSPSITMSGKVTTWVLYFRDTSVFPTKLQYRAIVQSSATNIVSFLLTVRSSYETCIFAQSRTVLGHSVQSMFSPNCRILSLPVLQEQSS